MRWKPKDRTREWQRRFAWLPKWIDGEWIWLEAYERQYVDTYYGGMGDAIDEYRTRKIAA